MNLQILEKDNTCFKNPENPTCIDLFLTNFPRSFQNTTAITTGLPDFHKMTVTVLKNNFCKPKPKTVSYRCYKTFNCNLFRKELKEALTCVSNYLEFQTIYLKVLDIHAPMKMKSVRANQVPYMTKPLRKAIMIRSSLKNKLYKNLTPNNSMAYKKQRNYCSRLYKKEREKYFEKLNVKKVMGNNEFWKTVKPFLSDRGNSSSKITLVEGDDIISEDQEVAQKLNDFFSNGVKFLEIPKINSYLTNPTDQLTDSLEIDIIGTTVHNIYSGMITYAEFPDDLKLADIYPLYKGVDATNKKNYRPIRILPAISKVFEKKLQKQITGFVDRFLYKYMFGYRKGYSTHNIIGEMENYFRQSWLCRCHNYGPFQSV